MEKLILASSSTRRINIMKWLGLDFEAISSDFDERSVPLCEPRAYVKKLAENKAMSVAGNFPDRAVISADTVVVCSKMILNKPHDEDEARAMLRSLSGKTNQVVTGICVFDGKTERKIVKSVVTSVKFRVMVEQEIETYLKSGVLDKAGAWNIGDGGSVFIKRITGSYTNILGIPVEEMLDMFDRLGIKYGYATF